jgi:transposase
MRGSESKQSSMLCLMSPESRVPQRHPLRAIKALAEAALDEISPLLDAMYSTEGRPSIPPEQLLKAQLLMALYTVRSERLFCEQLDYNLLFRWFLNMSMVEESFDHSTFSFNRVRLIEHDVARQFFAAVVGQARAAGLLSGEHFTVDGTLVDAWASHKSFKRKSGGGEQGPGAGGNQAAGTGGGQVTGADKKASGPDAGSNPTVDFRGEKRSNATHESTTDPEAKLARKGPSHPARLSYAQHALMDNRHGLLVDLRVSEAHGRAERQVALEMLTQETARGRHRTVGADKAYDVRGFVDGCRAIGVTPHVAQNPKAFGGTAIDGRTTRWAGYRISERLRKRVEEIFGWTKTVGNFRRTRYRGLLRTELASYFVAAGYNLLRIANLLARAT